MLWFLNGKLNTVAEAVFPMLIFGLQSVFGIAAGVFAFIFYIQVSRQTLMGRTQPNPTSWFIWSANDTLIFVSSIAAGAKNSLWVPLVYTMFGWIVFACSLKGERRRLSIIDQVCLVGAAVGWVAYYTSSAFWPLIFGSLVNSLGGIPTIRSAFSNPERENLGAWRIIWLSSLLMFLSIERSELSLWLFPVSSLVNSSLVVVGLSRRTAKMPHE